MHCPVCNTNKEQREEMKDRFCGCCADKKHISFHRYVQWRLGWVCWLDGSGNDASFSEMNRRCNRIILDCYEKVGKKVNRTWNECEDSRMSPPEVANFYAAQFQGKDCIR